jgi:hypothetical protein
MEPESLFGIFRLIVRGDSSSFEARFLLGHKEAREPPLGGFFISEFNLTQQSS